LPAATFKICIFGDGGAGKTTLIQRFVTGKFNQSTQMTIGVDIVTKHLKIENWNVIIQIWDFGGEDRFRFFLPAYARGSFGGIFMYDITRYNTLSNFDEWLSVFKKGASYDLKPIPILMVGGKGDLESNRNISFEQAQNFALSRNIYNVIECSSKTGQNVEFIFYEITRKILKNAELL
jgi:small GTP-binding protein